MHAMKYLKIALFLFVFPVLISATTHKFYVSITKVEFAEDEQAVQIITKIFTDDIEEALRQRYRPTVELGTEKETEADAALLEKYILQKIKIRINGEPATLNYLGNEYDNDVVKAYIEVTGVTSLEEIFVDNQLLTDIYEEQQNIVHVKVGKKRKSLILEKEKPNGVLNF